MLTDGAPIHPHAKYGEFASICDCHGKDIKFKKLSFFSIVAVN